MTRAARWPGPSPDSRANWGRISSRAAPVDQPPLPGISPATPGPVAAARHAPTRAIAKMRPQTRPSVIDLIAHPVREEDFVGRVPDRTSSLLYQPEQPDERASFHRATAPRGLAAPSAALDDAGDLRRGGGRRRSAHASGVAPGGESM